LRRGNGNEYGAAGRAEHETNIYEAAGPEAMVGVRQCCAQRHLAGFVLHCVIDESELARYCIS